MTFEEFKLRIGEFQKTGLKIFATSSFQSHSLPMLHMISRIDHKIPIMFLQTGYLFPESIRFRDQIADRLNLNVVELRPLVSRIQQRDTNGNLYFTSDTERCCYLNKVQPLEPVLGKYDIWINGIRSDQNQNRSSMAVEQPAPFGCKRFHPMLTWTTKMIYEYCQEHNLPSHPMEAQGYLSIGCEPCTIKTDLSDPRSGRWNGQTKTECGLHTDLAKDE